MVANGVTTLEQAVVGLPSNQAHVSGALPALHVTDSETGVPAATGTEVVFGLCAMKQLVGGIEGGGRLTYMVVPIGDPGPSELLGVTVYGVLAVGDVLNCGLLPTGMP